MFLKELLKLFSLMLYTPSNEDLIRVCDEFDVNRDLDISPNEYKTILEALGKKSILTKEVTLRARISFFFYLDEFVEVYRSEGGVHTTIATHVLGI